MILSQRSIWSIVISSVLSISYACTNEDAPPELEVDVNINPAPAPITPAAELAALNKVTGKKGRLYDEVQDVRAILIAKGLTRKNLHKDATQAWFEALKISHGQFGKKALEGWINSYGHSMAKKAEQDFWVKLLLSETKNGQLSPYMSEKNINTAEAIAPLVKKHLGQWLEESSYKPNPDYDPPGKKAIPKDDPILADSAKSFCKADEKQKAKWNTWSNGLSKDVRTYWRGLTQRCSGNAGAAMEAFESSFKKLGSKISTRPLAINGAENLAVLQRRNGRRTGAAETYKSLMEIWAMGKVKRNAFGEDRTEYHLRKINDALWAARYRALIADHENAKIYAQNGMDSIRSAYSESVSQKEKFKEELVTLNAEAQHILAFRIAVEQGEFDRAQSTSLSALEDKELNEEWVDRLTWITGFYDYLNGNYATAQKRWLKMLDETKDETLRPKLYFWLAKAHDRMGQEEESEHYLDALVEDFPVSYYSVVAPQKSGLGSSNDWRKAFGDLDELRDNLKEGLDYNLGHIRKDSELGPQLLRSEILVAAGLKEWARMAITQYSRGFSKRFILENHGPEYVYLSRLHYNSGNFLKAIALTTKLMRGIPRFWKNYPEQVLIYFPKPYLEIYRKEGLENRLDAELLMAVSRQESGFTPDIKSWAGAIGVMQLTQPTALRFAEELNVDTSDIVSELKKPDVNIKMGSQYLRVLNRFYKGYKPAVYGGYNAGEFAMNAWMKRRAHSDPMVFVELIPFGETQGYVKNVWRNLWIYHHLRGEIASTKQPVVSGSTPKRAPEEAQRTPSAPSREEGSSSP